MPLYEYACDDCGQTFEKLVSVRDRDNEGVCPGCGSEHVQRLVSAFAIGRSNNSSSSSSDLSCPTCTTGTCNLG